jgi:hypothetical protein
MKIIVLTLSLFATLAGNSAPLPVHGSVWSREGTCRAAEFQCDHVTVATLDDGKVLLQFTEYAGHYVSIVGRSEGELVSVDESYLDGLSQAHAGGQCSLVFKALGELSEVICPSFTFTVTKDSK